MANYSKSMRTRNALANIENSTNPKYRRVDGAEETGDDCNTSGVPIPSNLHDVPVLVRFVRNVGLTSLGLPLTEKLGSVNSTQKLVTFVGNRTQKLAWDRAATYQLLLKYGDNEQSWTKRFTYSQLAETWETELHRVFLVLLAREQCHVVIQIELSDNLKYPCDDKQMELIQAVPSNKNTSPPSKNTRSRSRRTRSFTSSTTDDSEMESTPASSGSRRPKGVLKSIQEVMDSDLFTSEDFGFETSSEEDVEEDENDNVHVCSDDGSYGASRSHSMDDGQVYDVDELTESSPKPKPTFDHRSPYFLKMEKQRRRRETQKKKAQKDARERLAKMNSNVGKCSYSLT